MECETNNSYTCIECANFKRLITPTAVVKKIAENLGLLDAEVKYAGNGIYILGIFLEGKVVRKVIRCEREDFSWSDYCIRCYLL